MNHSVWPNPGVNPNICRLVDIGLGLDYLYYIMSNILFHIVDPRSLQVLLHQSRYINHIWPSHPIVEVDDIRLVIAEPDLITQDIQSNEIENDYRQEVIPEFPDLYLKVCVLFKSTDQGRVITAFTVNWPKPEEELLWQK